MSATARLRPEPRAARAGWHEQSRKGAHEPIGHRPDDEGERRALLGFDQSHDRHARDELDLHEPRQHLGIGGEPGVQVGSLYLRLARQVAATRATMPATSGVVRWLKDVKRCRFACPSLT